MTKHSPVMVTEAAFQKGVIQLARLLGWRVAHFRPAQDRQGRWKTPMQGDPGFPDLVLAKGGRVIFAELKRDTKAQLSPEQKLWLKATGGQCWTPADWLHIEHTLRRH